MAAVTVIRSHNTAGLGAHYKLLENTHLIANSAMSMLISMSPTTAVPRSASVTMDTKSKG